MGTVTSRRELCKEVWEEEVEEGDPSLGRWGGRWITLRRGWGRPKPGQEGVGVRGREGSARNGEAGQR